MIYINGGFIGYFSGSNITNGWGKIVLILRNTGLQMLSKVKEKRKQFNVPAIYTKTITRRKQIECIRNKHNRSWLESCVLVKKKENSVKLAGCTFCHVFCTIIITRSRRALFLVGKLFYRFDTVKHYYSVKLWSMLIFCAFVFWWECSLIPVMFFQPLWTNVIHFHLAFVNRINVMFRHFFYILGLWTLAKTTIDP